MKVRTASDMFGISGVDEHHRWVLTRGTVKHRMRQLGITHAQIGQPSQADASAERAIAYVNHGRWVADCPSDYCGGAMAVTPGLPFMCGTCLNVEIGCKYRLVEWPQVRGAIEEALSERPVPEVMNWRPGETVKALRDETGAHMIRRR